MSNPGFFQGDIDPAAQRRQALAQALFAPQGAEGGIGQLGSALAMKAFENRQAQKAWDAQPAQQMPISLPQAGGGTYQGNLNLKMPYAGPQGLAGLFSFGGAK